MKNSLIKKCIEKIISLRWIGVVSLILFIGINESQAAIVFVKNVGTKATKGAHTQLQIVVPAAGVAAGNTVIIGIATDYSTNNPPPLIPICSDSKGNTYTVDVEYNYNNAYQGTICSAPITTALVSGDTITVTHTSINASAMSASEFSGLLTASALDKTASAYGHTTNVDSTVTATTAQADELLFGSITSENPPTTTFTAGGTFISLPSAGTSGASASSNMTAFAEYRIVSSTGTYNATGTLSASPNSIALIATYKAVTAPSAVTTISNFVSAEPGNSTVAPNASGMVDSFGFATDSGTDTVTAATVGLATGTGQYIQTVAITNNGDTVTYCSAAPSGDTASLSTCGIPVSTTNTQFKIKLTAKTHASMPVPSGGSYNVTATVTGFTSTNSQTGTDSGSSTLTIDNTSPNGATSVSGTAGNTANTINWTTSNSGDFDTTNGSVILRWASSSAGAEVPAEGNSSYVAGNTITTATVACVISSATSAAQSKVDGTGGSAGCTTTALTNGQAYTYKAFQRDTNGNYDAGVLIGTFTPAGVTLRNISGAVTSSVFDSTGSANGGGYHSIYWKGTLGAGGTGKVRFQFAAADATTGPWNFIGGTTCQAGDWFTPSGPETPVELIGTGASASTCRSAWNNKRYFRYKIQICSDDCVTAGPNTPTVNGVVVSWAQ